MPISEQTEADQSRQSATDFLAVAAEVLYLVNLLLLPVIAFIILLLMFFLRKDTASVLARSHMKQAVITSLWAAALLVIVNGIILLVGGYHGPYVWMTVIIYFTLGHSSFILLGVIGLIKALAGQYWQYPLVGCPPADKH
ncbi:MAG: hypothetical protein PVG66_02420 [Chromatiales bacterium]|jgi:uncharacterized membrane protein